MWILTQEQQQEEDKTPIPLQLLKDMQDNAPATEIARWIKLGAKQTEGLYQKDNKPCLPRSLFKTAAVLSHGPSHVSTGGWWT